MDTFQIPGFELIEKIGQGGMAVVWKARQVSLDRIVAIKFLKPQMTCETGEVERLLAEARAAARLKHQGIVQVYDANVVDGVPYIVLEYVAGYTVGEWTRRKGHLEERDTLLVAQCVANALNHAWKTAHIIHCDIKPDNLMVDRDGTIKVADLGLSQTIGLRGARQPSDEIMGTPNYISPEQSQGTVALDCRADIYSLGATLYHLATGRRLFQDHSDIEAMDLQITAQDSDPMEVNPQLSPAICFLIEKMLAKPREARQPDWDTVLRDIAAVQHGRMPVSAPLPQGTMSTVRRSSKRPVLRQVHLPKNKTGAFGAATASAPSRVSAVCGWILVLAIIGIGIWVWPRMSSNQSTPPSRPPKESHPPPETVVPAETPGANTEQDLATTRAKEIFDTAQQWAQTHSNDYREACSRFQTVAFEARGTKYEPMAMSESRRYQEKWRKHLHDIQQEIFGQAQKLSEQGQWIQAAEYLEQYQGDAADDTANERTQKAAECREKAQALEQQQREANAQEEQQSAEVLRAVAQCVVSGQVDRAQSCLEESLRTKTWNTPHTEMLKSAQRLMESAAAVDRNILESFRPQMGREIILRRQKGNSITVTVHSITTNAVVVEQRTTTGGTVLREYRVADLSVTERFQRLGNDERDDVALIRGMMACQAKAYGKATNYFGKVGTVLSGPLIEQANLAEQSLASQQAARKERRLDQAQPSSPNEATTAGETKEPSPPSVPLASEIPQGKPISSEEMDRLVMSLRDLNLGLDRESIRPSMDDRGCLVKLAIISKSLINIAPLKDLKSLQVLILSPAEEGDRDYRGPPAPLHEINALSSLSSLRQLDVPFTMVDDLTPLRTLRLRSINLRKTPVKDVAMLQNSPLEEITLSGTDVKDIGSLRGKSLRYVEMNRTKVQDLSSLGGSAKTLRVLEVGGGSGRSSQVRDIAVLRNMIALKRLSLSYSSVSDFGALKFLPLEFLNLEETQFKDVGICKDMPLKQLILASTKVSDLTPLSEKDLVYLDLRGTMVKDLAPLRRMPLTSLLIAGTRVRTLVPLRGIKLENLDLDGTPVKDISVLEGMPLSVLTISGTEIIDISVLKNLPLRSLHLDTKRIIDFTPLRGMELDSIWIDGDARDFQPLRKELNSMGKLRSVNGDEHWRAWLNK